MKTIRIGNAAGFLGDQLEAPKLLAAQGGLDYLTLEYLAELTLSILAHQKSRDPQGGYAGDFVTVFPDLIPLLKEQPGLKIVTNAGGMNPRACAEKIASLLAAAGMPGIVVGVVSGDDLASRLPDLLSQGETLAHFDTAKPLGELQQKVASANAYLGAQGIAEALQKSARIVITGRVADASLTLGPAMYEFGWAWDDWDRLAAATVAGHIIECGAQATGGMFSPWTPDLNLAEVGYPIAELTDDGGVVITKPGGTGGLVDVRTVGEQLVYEIGDPAHYLTPDVDTDFTHLQLVTEGRDRVRVTGAKGAAPPETYKVSLAYQDGWMATGTLVICGPEAAAKARHCGEMILARCQRGGFALERSNIECLGAGDSLPGIWPRPQSAYEVVLRVTVHDQRKEAVNRFVREFAPLVTSGPPGVTGYTGPRAKPYPVLAYWPSRIKKTQVPVRVELITS